PGLAEEAELPALNMLGQNGGDLRLRNATRGGDARHLQSRVRRRDVRIESRGRRGDHVRWNLPLYRAIDLDDALHGLGNHRVGELGVRGAFVRTTRRGRIVAAARRGRARMEVFWACERLTDQCAAHHTPIYSHQRAVGLSWKEH